MDVQTVLILLGLLGFVGIVWYFVKGKDKKKKRSGPPPVVREPTEEEIDAAERSAGTR